MMSVRKSHRLLLLFTKKMTTLKGQGGRAEQRRPLPSDTNTTMSTIYTDRHGYLTWIRKSGNQKTTKSMLC